MSKKMLNTTVLKSTDSQRVGIKEILSIENSDGNKGPRRTPKSPHPGPTTSEGDYEGNGGTLNPKKPKSPHKSLDERIAEALNKALVPVITSLDERIANALTITLKPVVNHLEHIDSRLDRLEVRLTKVENRLDKQDEFNKVVIDYMKSHS
jgi:hypothetical protein